jgi:hypothetical protein
MKQLTMLLCAFLLLLAGARPSTFPASQPTSQPAPQSYYQSRYQLKTKLQSSLAEILQQVRNEKSADDSLPKIQKLIDDYNQSLKALETALSAPPIALTPEQEIKQLDSKTHDALDNSRMELAVQIFRLIDLEPEVMDKILQVMVF